MLCCDPVEKKEERIPEAIDIQEDDGFAMVPEMFPGYDLYQLINRAETARQNKVGLSPFGEFHLSFMHGFNYQQLTQSVVGNFAFLKKAGDDSFDGSAMFQYSIGNTAHQSYPASAEDQPDTSFCKFTAEICGCAEVLPGRLIA
jgi:hypothetical protein